MRLTLVEVDPHAVLLDATNPRVGFSMRQLNDAERSDEACTLLLTSQEATEELKRSIVRSNGVQEPIYLRSDRRVAEGNRRVVALRTAKEEHPGDPRFQTMPAWQIPDGTPEAVIQDLLNEIHLGSVRGWAPYEKALQMRGLLESGLLEEEIAERYRLTAREVKQQLAAVALMDSDYFPITEDPTDSDHRSKFSYFLEYCKNTRIQEHCATRSDLSERFARWVRDERIDTGARVRRLPRILDSAEATRLLEVAGFDAADEYLSKLDPSEEQMYGLIERARARLASLTVTDLLELGTSPPRVAMLEALRDEVVRVLETAARVRRTS